MSAIAAICNHCEGPLVGKAYRVMSEEAGVTMLDMTVCHACYEEARRLGLKTEELDRPRRSVDGG